MTETKRGCWGRKLRRSHQTRAWWKKRLRDDFKTFETMSFEVNSCLSVLLFQYGGNTDKHLVVVAEYLCWWPIAVRPLKDLSNPSSCQNHEKCVHQFFNPAEHVSYHWDKKNSFLFCAVRRFRVKTLQSGPEFVIKFCRYQRIEATRRAFVMLPSQDGAEEVKARVRRLT